MDKEVKIKFNILAIIGIIIFCFAVSPITLQNDTFYTIKIGEHILENGIDMQDPFSWHEDLPYTYPHWGYDVTMYLVYQLGEITSIGGMTSIYISTILFSCILGLVTYFVNTKLTKNNLISFLLTLGVMALLKNFVAARAQLITYILFILTIFNIEQFIETKKKRYAIVLVIISLIIANIHVAVWPFFFVLFLPYIAEYVITIIRDGYYVRKYILKRNQNRLNKYIQKQVSEEKIEQQRKVVQLLEERIHRNMDIHAKMQENPYKIIIKRENNVKWLILIMVICALMGLITPIGDTPYTYLLKTFQGNTTRYISEHQPMVFAENGIALGCVIFLVGILTFTDTKIRLRDLFMIGGLVFLAITSKRQFAILTIIGVIILNRLICYFLNKYDKTTIPTLMKFINTYLGKALVLSIVVIFSLLIFKDKIGNKFIDNSSYPVGAADYILENIDIENMRLYNEYNYGSYLLYRGIPVFIDSRADLYAPEFNGKEDIFSDFMNVSGVGTYYESIFSKYDFTHVLMYKNAKLNLFVSKDDNYRQIYQDNNFIMYEKIN